MFCKYKDLFGKPNEGLHSYRLPGLDLAALDVILTFFVGLIIWGFATNKKSFFQIMVILILIGIILHRLLCVRTKIDKFLFPNA
jgi:hypothetical protein